MATKYSIQNISSIQGRKVFFDANVLIYIFWSTGSFNLETSYSSAYGLLYRQKNKMCVDFMIISEVINRILRIEYEKYIANKSLNRNSYPYKKYRDSKDGQDSLNDIYLLVNDNIVDSFEVLGKTFSKADVISFLNVEPLDFNDKGVLQICKDNDCVLLTNDSDFKTYDIDILTSNPDILRN